MIADVLSRPESEVDVIQAEITLSLIGDVQKNDGVITQLWKNGYKEQVFPDIFIDSLIILFFAAFLMVLINL